MSGIGRRGSVCRCQRYAPRSYSESGLTHTETHTGKRADKNNGEDRTYLPQYTERKGSKSPENRQTERPDRLRNQQVMCSSHTTSSKKHRKLRFSVLFCCQNTETVILPAFDRRRRCCSLLRYFLRWKVFDELLHGGCRVGLLLHSKADWVVIGLLQERISILYGMRCKIRPGRMLTPRPLSTIAVMAKSSQAVK